jgi:serine/threonine protein phosphatase PrpC
MEDRHVVEKDVVKGVDCYAVFDGHGGDKVAEICTNVLVSELREAVRNLMRTAEEYSTTKLVKNITAILHDVVHRLVKKIPREIGTHCGTTAVIMLLIKNEGGVPVHVGIVNVGDSRAIMQYGQQVHQITRDHKPEAEVQRIIESGGKVIQRPNDVPRVNGTLAVSRSIGDFYLAPHVIWKPDIYDFAVNANLKMVVLATDGIWDAVSNYEVVEHLNLAPSKIGCYRAMVMARERGSGDNITIMAIQFSM